MRRASVFALASWLYVAAMLSILIVPAIPSHAVESGKTFDTSNWEELEGAVIPPMLDWVKKGEFIIRTGELGFDYTLSADFLEASQKNAGEYDLDEAGAIVSKKDGKFPKHIYGLPFPQIDPEDPAAGAKIFHNFKYGLWRIGSHLGTGRVMWVGSGGFERDVVASAKDLFYQGRKDPMKNPQRYRKQSISYVQEPFNLRGLVSLTYEFNDMREDNSWVYVPILRRMRRISASAHSDPFLGSDMCTDDTYMFQGKNEDFTWKLLGEQTILCTLSTTDKVKAEDLPDGTFKIQFPNVRVGFEVEGWQGAPWAIADATWIPRSVWVVECTPHDPYYNYGKQIFYVDKKGFNIWYKVIDDRAGDYWKTLILCTSLQMSPSGRNNIGQYDGLLMIDERERRATWAKVINYSGGDDRFWLPLEVLGPKDFTIGAVLKMTTK